MGSFVDDTPIVIADSGPLLRLAASGLLPTLRGLNRQIVLIDRVKDELCQDITKPYANEIATWIISMNGAILQVKTIEGAGITALQAKTRNEEEEQLLKVALRDSGERAIREYIERLNPQDHASILVVYEDKKVPQLLAASNIALTLMTTRRFVRQVQEWGVNINAVEELEAISGEYNLKPSIYSEIDPLKDEDL